MADPARQELIPDARHIHGDRMREGRVFFRPHEVAEFQPEREFAGILGCEQRGVQARADGESEFLAQGLYEFDLAPWAIRRGAVAMNITEVALNPGVAPDTHLSAEAELVHGARVGFDK